MGLAILQSMLRTIRFAKIRSLSVDVLLFFAVITAVFGLIYGGNLAGWWRTAASDSQLAPRLTLFMAMGVSLLLGTAVVALRRWWLARAAWQTAVAEQAAFRALLDLPEQLRGTAPAEAWQTAVTDIAAKTAWEGVTFLQVKPIEQTAVVVAASSRLAVMKHSVFDVSDGALGEAWQMGEARELDDWPAVAFQHSLAVPVVAETAVGGMLTLHQRNPITPDQQTQAQQLAARFAAVWRDEAAQLKLVEQGEQLTLWHHLSRLINSDLSLEVMLTRSLALVMSTLDMPAGQLVWGDTQVQVGLDEPAATALARSWGAFVAGQEAVVCVPDFWAETKETRLLRQDFPQALPALKKGGWRSGLGVALARGDETMGGLFLLAEDSRPFGEDIQLLLPTVGRQMATAVAKAAAIAPEPELAEPAEPLAGEMLTAVWGALPVGMLFINHEQKLVLANDPARQMLALRRQLWRGDDGSNQPDALRQRAPALLKLLQGEHAAIQQKNGEPLAATVSVAGRKVRWQSSAVWVKKQFAGRLVYLQDDAAVNPAQQQWQADVFHTTVHDLRNPLAALDGCVDVLEDSPTPQDEAILFDLMRRNLQQLHGLVGNILDVDRLEQGALPLTYAPFELQMVVDEVLAGQQLLAAQEQIALCNEVTDQVPIIWADEQLVRRVLQNLVGNALKFTPLGGEVQVSAAVVQGSAGSKVQVVVRDSGVGVSAVGKGKLFERYQTGDARRGFGWGLAFCQMALSAHGQEIWVESEGETGNAFCFTLSAVTPEVRLAKRHGRAAMLV